ncbi:MAG: LysM peptidoglycan-binding domain-containing protein [candidate division Zixibacteria bacterium]|nr:LysM peptidoglycan-binding domain-containing protein [candidate division Zixibacteria bacterium]
MPRLLYFVAVVMLVVAGCSSAVRENRTLAVATNISTEAESPSSQANVSESIPANNEAVVAAQNELNLAEEYFQYGVQANSQEQWQEAQYNFERALTILSDLDVDPTDESEIGQRYFKLLGDIRSEYKLTLLYLATLPGETSSSAFVDRFLEIDDFSKLREEPVVTDVDKTAVFDVPVIVNEKVENCIIYFQTLARDFFQAALTRSGKYSSTMIRILEEEGLPRDLVYLPLIESGYKTNAYSWAAAVGPWQFISGTGKQYGLYRNWWYDERRDFEKSTRAAARYLTFLYNRYGDWYLALAAYNAGEGRVDRAVKRENTTDYFRLRSLARETKDYVPLFLAATIIAKNPEKYGFASYFEEPIDYETVTIDKCVDLRDVARSLGTSLEYLQHLNPELLRNVTPPNAGSYRLRIPTNMETAFWAAYDGFEKPKASGMEQHTIRRGETWASIAKKYGVSAKSLAAANNASTKSKLIAGRHLLVPIQNPELARSGGSSSGKKSGSGSKSSALAANGTYTVRKGDNLWQIAEAHGTTVNDLRSLNGLGPYSELHPGQKLKVNASGTKAAGSKASSGKIMTYKVRKGDTLDKIAQKYGTSVQDIASINGMHTIDYLRVGQLINVPASGASASSKSASKSTASAGKKSRSGGVLVYVVKAGDTLWDIAKSFGTTVEDIVTLNGLSSKRVKVGDRLKVKRG